LNLCHVDAYRLSGPGELPETGFYDYLDAGWVAAVEWSERLSLDPP
jgi:tRNA A37 threonylcarbamoyladenosine biosynthesis protein TsaE